MVLTEEGLKKYDFDSENRICIACKVKEGNLIFRDDVIGEFGNTYDWDFEDKAKKGMFVAFSEESSRKHLLVEPSTDPDKIVGRIIIHPKWRTQEKALRPRHNAEWNIDYARTVTVEFFGADIREYDLAEGYAKITAGDYVGITEDGFKKSTSATPNIAIITAEPLKESTIPCIVGFTGI